jgi:prefoldin subunit 5
MIEMVQRRRRAIGAGLTAYGLAGIVAGFVIVGATLAVGSGLEPAVASVERQRDALVASLERSSSALDQSAAIAGDAAAGAQQAAAIASQSADVSRQLAETLSRLSSTFGDFGILGTRPFEPLAEDAAQVAAQLRGIATNLDALGISLSRIAREIPPLAVELEAVAAELTTLATELATFAVPDAAAEAFRWLVVGVVMLVAWLLVPALASLAAGIALLRRPRRLHAP